VSAPKSIASRVIFFVVLTVFLDLVGFGIIIPLLPLYVKSMGGDALTVGLLFSCFAGTQFVATPILGRISDRFGRRRVILTSLAGNTLSMVLFAFATYRSALVLLFASRILAGATAGNLAACQASIADVTEGDARAAGMGRVGAGIALGMIFGPFIGSVASTHGAWVPPLVAAALAGLDLVGAFFFMPETRGPEARAKEPPSASRAPLTSLLAEARVIAVLALFFLTFLYMTNLQVALPLLVGDRFGWTGKEVGYIFLGFGVQMFVVQGLLIGRLSKRFGASNLVVFGAVSSMTGLVFIAIAHAVGVLVLGLVLLGLGLGVTQPLLSTIASQYAGASRTGALLGVAQSAGGLARTVGPTVSGLLYKELGSGAPFVGGALVAVAALSVALSMRGAMRAPREPTTA
jgi:MFS family permease